MTAEIVSGQQLWDWRTQALDRYLSQVQQSQLQTELDWLLQEVAGLERLSLRLETYKQQSAIPLKCTLAALTELWQQHWQTGMPLQYLLGVVPWRNLQLRVSPAVLIPRPETEELIDLAIGAIAADFQLAGRGKTGHWVDLGTGSGAIAIGLALALPGSTVHAVDCSAAALEVARSNRDALGLQERLKLYQGQWLEPLTELSGQMSGIVSNPPYIPTAMIAELEREVADHEPHLALDGGEDGLDCLRQIISSAPDFLDSGGILLLEMMIGQAEAVKELLAKQGQYDRLQIHTDLSGVERFALAYRI